MLDETDFKSDIIKGCRNMANANQYKEEIEHGERLLQEVKIDEALKIFESVLEKDPDNVIALNDKGVAFNSLGRYGEAIKMFLDVLQKDQNNSNAVFNLISNYFAVAEWSKAENILKLYGDCLAQTDVNMIKNDLERNIPAMKSKETPIVCSICESSELRKSNDERIEIPDAAAQHMLDHHKIGRFEDFLTKVNHPRLKRRGF